MSNKDTRTRVASAFRAMKAIGICEDKVKPVLKSLLKLYDKNWELIEVENYRALADAIFEREELEAQERAKKTENSEAAEHSKKINTQTEDHLEEGTHAAEESVRPLKRLRLRHRDGQTSTVNSSDQGTIRTPFIRPKDEPVDTLDLPINGPAATGKSPQSMEESATIESQAATLPSLGRDKGKQHVSADINEGCDPSQTGSMSKNQQKTQLETEPISQSHSMRLRDRRPGVSPQMTSKEKRPVPDSSDHALCLKEPKDEPENVPTLDKKSTSKQALIKVKDEPITDDMPCLEAPVVGHTETSKRGDSLSRHGMLRQNNSPESSALQCLSDKETANGTNTVNQPTNNGKLSLPSVVCSPNVEIASSHSGDARIDLNCHLTSGRSDFTVPSLEAVLKCVEDKCFKPLDPNISLMSIMKEICQCFLDLGTNSSSQSTIVGISPNTNLSKCSASDGQGGAGNLCTSSLNGLVDSQTGAKLPESHTLVLPCDRMNNGVQPNINAEDNIMTNRETEENYAKKTNGVSLEFGQQPPETPSNKVDDGEQQNKMDTGDKVDDEGLLKQVDAGDNMDDGEQQKKMDDGEQQKKMDAGEQQKLMDDGEHQKQMDDGEQQKHMDDGEQQKQMDDGEQQNKMNAGGKVDDGEQQKQMDAGDNMDDGEQQNQTDAGDKMDDGEQQNQTDAGGEMVTTSGTQENHVQVTIDQSLDVVKLSQPTPGTIVPFHDVVDIAKGQENVIITLVNEVNDESPPSFYYIPQNAAFQNAYVNFSLARIGDKNCCATCSMDCLSSSIPCACTHESGGEFAYTSDGLVKEELLKESISMNRDPKKHSQYFCKECPLERSKCGDIIEPCKGHLVRKFIKECWWKCGCGMQCGNRVVQRGISRKLQVFMAPGGKGWGLRTLEDLPKGAFVCEYVGEVLTNAELFERVLKSPQGEKHSYPVLLDADWCAEAVLKDEEALCLDATYYGNVARFINHRCYDSNLVEIPVEVETPDHHYYHLAFFTSRKVKAMEELTWDYGIDFDDHDHPIKAFRCQCGSKFCRNIKRSRSRSKRW